MTTVCTNIYLESSTKGENKNLPIWSISYKSNAYSWQLIHNPAQPHIQDVKSCIIRDRQINAGNRELSRVRLNVKLKTKTQTTNNHWTNCKNYVQQHNDIKMSGFKFSALRFTFSGNPSFSLLPNAQHELAMAFLVLHY